MKSETLAFLRKANKHPARARIMLEVKLYEDAGRGAYLACFHAAQALIFERRGKAVKTHQGVQMEFFRLTQGDSKIAPDLRVFLA